MSVFSEIGPFGIVSRAAARAILETGTATTLAVYVVLSTHADRNEETEWKMSQKAIADEAGGITPRSVGNACKVLEDLGLLERSANWTPDGDRGWDSYLVRFVPTSGTVDAEVGKEDSPPPQPGFIVSYDPSSDPTSESMLRSIEEEFEVFWETYRKTGPRKKAWQCYVKARTKADAETILTGLGAWLTYWALPGAAAVKWPQGWLNEERWNDEPPTVTATKGATGSATGQLARINQLVADGMSREDAERRVGWTS